MKKLLIPLAFLLPAASLSAAITYATAGSSYTQDFNTLASDNTGTNTWANDTTVQGWYWWSSTNSTPATYLASATTTATQNQILSLGKRSDLTAYTSTVGDRALGGQGNTTNTTIYGMQVLNTTGTTLNTFTLTYKGEQWRTINNESADKLTLEYAVFTPNATNRLATASTTGWTSIASLQFNAPTQVTTGSIGIDGNANSATLMGSSTAPLNWTNGSELWIRWRDNGSPQSAMGVDDIVFSAVPEPSALLLGALGLLPLLRRKR